MKLAAQEVADRIAELTAQITEIEAADIPDCSTTKAELLENMRAALQLLMYARRNADRSWSVSDEFEYADVIARMNHVTASYCIASASESRTAATYDAITADYNRAADSAQRAIDSARRRAASSRSVTITILVAAAALGVVAWWKRR